MSETPAGEWHPDPSGRHEQRYWDGAQWTDHVSDGGVTSVDPMPPAPPVAAGQPRGPLGRPTAPATQILLTIVTLGIWAAVWTYRQHEDIKHYTNDGVGGAVGVILFLLTGIVTPFLLTNEIETKLYQREGQQSPIRTVEGCWILLPIIGGIIWYLKAQRALNDFWVARGAAPPA